MTALQRPPVRPPSPPATARGGSPPPRATADQTSAWLAVASEVALLLVTCAAVLGLTRLFSDASFMPKVMVAVVGSHALASVLRRLGVGPLPAAVISGLGLLMVVIWVVEPATTSLGIPTGETWDQISADLREAWDKFGEVVAPTPVTRGFVLAAVLGAWSTGFIADLFAFRLRTRFEALVPSFTVFLFGAILGADRHRLVSTAAYLGAVLMFVVFTDGSGRMQTMAWFGGRARRGERALLRTALAVGAVAVAAAVVIGPLLPKAQSAGMVGWRDRDRKSRSRVTVSPLVDIRARLVDQSDTEVFTVTADAPTYWRLTALDRFDGNIWSSMGSYRSAGQGALPSSPTSARSRLLRQVFSVKALSSVWLPAAYRPTRLEEGSDGVRFDRDSSSLLTDKPSADGQGYTVTSELPELTADELEGVTGPPPDDVVERYLDLPADLPPVVPRLAQQVVAGETTPYARAKALQDWFRSEFTYSTDIPAGHDDSAILRFLRVRRGYCEQFAGTFAAMARSLGMPARVAVGFTPGRLADDNLFHVTGRNAHAWPEVYIGDYGWVAFEPTPGRGLPGAEDYTQVQPAQDDPQPAATATTVASTPTTAVASDGPATTTGAGQAPAPPEEQPTSSGANPVQTALLFLVAATLAYVLGVPATRRWQRNRRRSSAHTPSERVLVAWAETEDELVGSALRRQPAETVAEYSSRVNRSMPEPPPGLDELAFDVAAATYSVSGVEDDAATRAEGTATAVRRHLQERRPPVRRVMRELDARPLLPVRLRQRLGG